MQSESIGALAAALAKAQGAIKPATYDGKATTEKYSYKYATLTALWDVAREALAANGLAVAQTTDIDSNGNILLITTLLHSSGEWIGGVYPVRAMDAKPQSMGSAMTYARRYALSAILGLVSDDDDDDGNAANGNQAQHKPAAQAPKPNGAHRQVPPPPPAEDEHSGNPFTEDEARELRKLNAIGSQLYGKEWEAKRHELAKWASNKRTESSKQLTLEELRTLTAKLEERQKQAVTA